MTSMFRIEHVDTTSLQQTFLDLPKTLHQGDPLWIAPSESSERQLAGFEDHGFYQHAESQAFVAFENDQPVGRILAIDHKIYADWNPDSVAYFGFFESTNEQKVANALFDSAGQWLLQKGHQKIRGPNSPSMNHTCGCLVDGFDQLPNFWHALQSSLVP